MALEPVPADGVQGGAYLGPGVAHRDLRALRGFRGSDGGSVTLAAAAWVLCSPDGPGPAEPYR